MNKIKMIALVGILATGSLAFGSEALFRKNTFIEYFRIFCNLRKTLKNPIMDSCKFNLDNDLKLIEEIQKIDEGHNHKEPVSVSYKKMEELKKQLWMSKVFDKINTIIPYIKPEAVAFRLSKYTSRSEPYAQRILKERIKKAYNQAPKTKAYNNFYTMLTNELEQYCPWPYEKSFHMPAEEFIQPTFWEKVNQLNNINSRLSNCKYEEYR